MHFDAKHEGSVALYVHTAFESSSVVVVGHIISAQLQKVKGHHFKQIRKKTRTIIRKSSPGQIKYHALFQGTKFKMANSTKYHFFSKTIQSQAVKKKYSMTIWGENKLAGLMQTRPSYVQFDLVSSPFLFPFQPSELSQLWPTHTYLLLLRYSFSRIVLSNSFFFFFFLEWSHSHPHAQCRSSVRDTT